MLQILPCSQKVLSSSHKLILHLFHYKLHIRQVIFLGDKDLEVSALQRRREQMIRVKKYVHELTNQNIEILKTSHSIISFH